MKRRSAVGTPQSAAQAADISPYRGDKDGRSKKFPLKGGMSRSEKGRCEMKRLSAVGTPQSAAQAADISPYRGDKDDRSPKFPLKGGMSRSDKGVSRRG